MAQLLRSELLDGIPHGFSTCDAEGVPELIPGARSVRLKQVHSARVVHVKEGDSWPHDARLEADAMVTRAPECVLAIVTADCAPVLLADRVVGVVGAAHAGWRGAHGGVLANTVAAMVELGAERGRIAAAIGPTIAQASYEVDEAFRTRFEEEDAAFFMSGRPGHYQFDLPAYVGASLKRAGVGRIDDLAQDTYTQPDRFHSFRRATHDGSPTEGRQFSLIGLPAGVA
ncbi:peptidoglycan editing factor PgeF [Erythrobacter litoralis]|uniref:Purine nucleoside phosphorylase n=1 Tax=Erythrobacter litoralis (strain HTCC2594) TaxID=314225 RepID=Q2N673_ERYLH|nr:hypothetical protein ELI_13630 [Erythrobacter litoralis HTCC2594]